VLVLGLLAVVAVLAGALGALAGAQAARWRAQSAADLGAVAGAQAVLRAVEDACAVAGLVVGRNGADLAGCDVRAGGVVEVRARVPFGPGDAWASARAGPRAARSEAAADP
jgi:secretion/DNA translocation related TadE-like protein